MLKLNLINKFINRAFSNVTSHLPRVSTTNGVRVATSDVTTNGTRITLIVNTGSRDDEVAGTTHALQTCSLLSTNQNTAFLTTQLLANYGASLDVTIDREQIKYEVECHVSNARDVIVRTLVPAVCGANYPHWEVKDVVEKMKIQKSFIQSNPTFQLAENIHKAAFKGGMANPILSPDPLIGSHSSDLLLQRFKSSFKNFSLVGAGITHQHLQQIAEEAFCDVITDDVTTSRDPATFAGREVHAEGHDAIQHLAIAFQGLSLAHDDVITLALLQHCLGTVGKVRYGSELRRGALNDVINAKLPGETFTTSCSNLNYSDCGLFVVHLRALNVDRVAQVMASQLACIAADGLSDDVIAGGRQRLLSELMMSSEDTRASLDRLAACDVIGKQFELSDVIDKVQAICSSDLKRVASSVFGGKKALATLGRISQMPSLQDL